MSGRWAPWTGEPEHCTCTRLAAATLEETLGCPRGWLYTPGAGFTHAPGEWRQ